MTNKYKQCRLNIDNWWTTAWLPLKNAVEGKVLTFDPNRWLHAIGKHQTWTVHTVFHGIVLDDKDFS